MNENKKLCDTCLLNRTCKYIDDFENTKITTSHPYLVIRCLEYISDKRYILGDKKQIIDEWRILNPQGTKMQCHKQTGISRPTINKFWKDDLLERTK